MNCYNSPIVTRCKTPRKNMFSLIIFRKKKHAFLSDWVLNDYFFNMVKFARATFNSPSSWIYFFFSVWVSRVYFVAAIISFFFPPFPCLNWFIIDLTHLFSPLMNEISVVTWFPISWRKINCRFCYPCQEEVVNVMWRMECRLSKWKKQSKQNTLCILF